MEAPLFYLWKGGNKREEGKNAKNKEFILEVESFKTLGKKGELSKGKKGKKGTFPFKKEIIY